MDLVALENKLIDRIYLTRVHKKFNGDVFFPKIGDEWKLISSHANRALILPSIITLVSRIFEFAGVRIPSAKRSASVLFGLNSLRNVLP